MSHEQHEQQHHQAAPALPTPPAVATPAAPKKPAPDLSKIKCYTVERNSIKKVLTAFAGKRGAWDGVPFQAPQVEITPETDIVNDSVFLSDLNWVGKDNVLKIVNIFLRRLAQDLWENAIPETGDNAGKFQESTFIQSVENLTAASLRISELQELLDDATQKYLGATDEFISDMAKATNQAEKDAATAKFKALANAVNSLKAQLDERKSKRSKEKNTEEVRPE